jgi:NhaP-type Na+/H+ or K+/H+ antiporter
MAGLALCPAELDRDPDGAGFLCLIGTRTSTGDKLFIGWFGPRGLATIVLAVLVLDEKLPGNDTIILAAGWTVLLSVIAHGVTANPLTRKLGHARRKPSIAFAPPIDGGNRG